MPTFAEVLRFKTKRFKTPLNLQFLEMLGDRPLFSDTVHYIPVRVSKSYVNCFSSGLFKPRTIFKIIECTRSKIVQSEVMFSNIKVERHETNVLGNPSRLAL